MAEDALAKARAIAARLSAVASGEGSELGKRKSRWDDPSGGDVSRPGLGSIKKKKVYIPVNEHPDINFLGLLIGPKGSTQKMLEEKSGAKILIRGRGSQKDGVPTGPDDDDDLHVCIEGTAEAVEIATKEVERLLFNPDEAMRLKREQLRNLAETRSGGGGGGGDGHYGPASGGSGGGGYHDDEETVELKVPNGMVGLIIGKGGENVQRMQAQCGVHVQIAKESEMRPGETHRTVILRGSADGVEEAKAQIEEMIEERMHRGRERRERDTRNDLAHLPFVLMIPIPNDKVGIVIGRSGATVRAIQDSTGTYIKVPPMPDENDPNTRTIAVGGTTQQATEAAHAEIWRVIHSQAQQQYQQQMQQLQQLQQQYRPPPEVPPISYMTIPDDKVGVVIGKGGATIKDLQHRTGTRIQVPPAPDPGSYPPVRTISIQGSEQAAFLARCEIETLLGLPPAGRESADGDYAAQEAQSTYGGEPGSYVNDPYADYFKDKTTVRGSHKASQSADAQQQQQQQQQQQYDPTAYYQQFWMYASYYGEAAARAYYGPWAPPVGTQPPEGVTIPPDPQQPQQPQQEQQQQQAAPEGGAAGSEAAAPAESAAAGNGQPSEAGAATGDAAAAAAAAASGQPSGDYWAQYYQQQQGQQAQPAAAGAAAESTGGQPAGAPTTTPDQQEAWNQYYQQYYQYYGTAPPGYPAGYDQQYQQQYQQQPQPPAPQGGDAGAAGADAAAAPGAGADAQSAT